MYIINDMDISLTDTSAITDPVTPDHATPWLHHPAQALNLGSTDPAWHYDIIAEDSGLKISKPLSKRNEILNHEETLDNRNK